MVEKKTLTLNYPYYSENTYYIPETGKNHHSIKYSDESTMLLLGSTVVATLLPLNLFYLANQVAVPSILNIPILDSDVPAELIYSINTGTRGTGEKVVIFVMGYVVVVRICSFLLMPPSTTARFSYSIGFLWSLINFGN